MANNHLEHLESSRTKLLSAIDRPDHLTFVLPHGNIGDELIRAGTKQLLFGLSVREIALEEVPKSRGETALLGGSGGWCEPFHGLSECLPLLEARFDRVIIMPSSFDTTVVSVKQVLANSRALIFARERTSYERIRTLCNAEIAHDCAFFFDYAPYLQAGEGVLTAFRTDRESVFQAVPPGNQDISITCNNLEQWLRTIARHEVIRTDRAHVTIAGAMLGKRVEYITSSYHKLPAIVEYTLQHFPVTRLPKDWLTSVATSTDQLTDTGRLRILAESIASFIPREATFLLVDDNQIGSFPLDSRIRVPFLERDGVYWGTPPDDDTAIKEFERMRDTGVSFAVFCWPSFWWFNYYGGFIRYLRSKFLCVIENDTLVIFDIRTPSGIDSNSMSQSSGHTGD
jgi:hypothetical protein